MAIKAGAVTVRERRAVTHPRHLKQSPATRWRCLEAFAPARGAPLTAAWAQRCSRQRAACLGRLLRDASSQPTCCPCKHNECAAHN